MNAFSKVLVVFVLLLSAGFAVSQMVLYSKRENYQALYDETKQKLEVQSEKAAKLEGERNDLQRERDDIKRNKEAEIEDLTGRLERRDQELADSSGKLTQTEEDLRSERTHSQKMVDTLQEKVKHIDTVEATNQGLKGDLRAAEAEIKGLEDDVLAKEENIAGLEADVAQLNKDLLLAGKERDYWATTVAQLKQQYNIVVSPERVPLIDGKVVAVDADLGTVVIDKGSKDDVKMACPFTIYRGTEFIAKVSVVEVHEEFCIARLEPGMMMEGKAWQTGDDATTRMY